LPFGPSIGKNLDATTSPQSLKRISEVEEKLFNVHTMHLKQFKWKTAPSARTKGPCMAFPHAEHVLKMTNVRPEY